MLVLDGDGATAPVMVDELARRGVIAVPVLGDRDDWAGLVAATERQAGPVAGVVQVLSGPPEGEVADLSPEAWRRGLEVGASRLLQVLREPLARPRPALRSVVAAMPCAAADPDRIPAPLAAVRGLLRTLRVEHPGVHVRVVAHDATGPAEVSALLVDELWPDGDGGPVDVAYLGGRRVGPAYLPAPAPRARRLDLGARPVVVLTGGARGITAQVARELARTGDPVLVLVGRTPRGPDVETEATRAARDDRAVRRALALDPEACPRPADVEPRLRAILARREVEATLADLRDLGAEAHYVAADLTAEEQVADLVATVHRRFGRIDGVVHGAGVLADALLVDKDPGSWARVLDAKAGSALLLLRHLDLDRLRFLVLFSSVAGLFGNRGQADYAAANTVLDALPALLRGGPTRVVSLSWGPWAGGMATPDVREAFRARGVAAIGLAAGARTALRETLAADPQEHVVLGDGPWVPRAAEGRSPQPDLGLVAGADGDWPGAARLLDPDRDVFLDQHRIDGAPVLPAAWALAMLVQGACPADPGAPFEVHEFRVQRGLLVTDGPVAVQVRPEPSRGERSWLLESAGTVHYRAHLAPAAGPPVPSVMSPAATRLPEATDADHRLAAACLFHGPDLFAVRELQALGAEGIRGRVRAPGGDPLDPLALDGAFQLAIVWCRSVLGATMLPAGFRRLVARPEVPESADAELACELRMTRQAGGLVVEATIVLGPPDRPVLRIDGMEFGCSPALNRLAPQPAEVRA